MGETGVGVVEYRQNKNCWNSVDTIRNLYINKQQMELDALEHYTPRGDYSIYHRNLNTYL